jgi:hypothetical protein
MQEMTDRAQMLRQTVDDRRRHAARDQALAPYLGRLREVWAAESDAGPDGGSRLRVRLDSWERTAIQIAFGKVMGGSRRRGEELLVEGVAVRSRLEMELARFDNALDPANGAGAGEAAQLIEQLVSSASLAFMLIDDAQREIQQAIVAGDMRAAKQITAIRGKIRGSLNHVSDRLGPEATRKAREMAADMARGDA